MRGSAGISSPGEQKQGCKSLIGKALAGDSKGSGVPRI